MSISAPAAKSLPLSFAPLPQQRQQQQSGKAPVPRAQTQHLWLALQLPQLALEVTRHTDKRPAIASEERGGRFVVAAANTAARNRGIGRGMVVNAAWALCPDLQVVLRESADETRRLQQLAGRLYCYSSIISVQSPDVLLVEIRASLRLFGGLQALLTRIEAMLHAEGHACSCGIAPSATAARLLAYAGDNKSVLEVDGLTAGLGRLPLSVLAVDLPDLLPRLQKLGLRRLADLFRLPRAGLRQRFGAGLSVWLEQALGQRPEPLEKWTPPRHYRAHRHLDDPLSVSAELLPIIDTLLQDFCAWLRARRLHGSGFVLHFYHHKRAATRLKLGFLRPTSNPADMRNLFELRMQRQQLQAPVVGLRLDSLRLTIAEPHNASWWSGRQQADTQWWRALEGLQARLGSNVVKSLACVDELRPELAWQSVAINTPGAQAGANSRPAWLLAEPRRLSPSQVSRLDIKSRPERICTGWWDDRRVQRDYFRAGNARQNLWVYRSVDGWFVHGYYEAF